MCPAGTARLGTKRLQGGCWQAALSDHATVGHAHTAQLLYATWTLIATASKTLPFIIFLIRLSKRRRALNLVSEPPERHIGRNPHLKHRKAIPDYRETNRLGQTPARKRKGNANCDTAAGESIDGHGIHFYHCADDGVGAQRCSGIIALVGFGTDGPASTQQRHGPAVGRPHICRSYGGAHSVTVKVTYPETPCQPTASAFSQVLLMVRDDSLSACYLCRIKRRRPVRSSVDLRATGSQEVRSTCTTDSCKMWVWLRA